MASIKKDSTSTIGRQMLQMHFGPFATSRDPPDENVECLICIEDMSSYPYDSRNYILNCNPSKKQFHFYHLKCLYDMINRENPNLTCPECRSPITDDIVKDIKDKYLYTSPEPSCPAYLPEKTTKKPTAPLPPILMYFYKKNGC